MYSVKHDRHATPCTSPHRATHCSALRESPTHWNVVECDSAHVYLYAHFWNFFLLLVLVFEHSGRGCAEKKGEDLVGISIAHSQKSLFGFPLKEETGFAHTSLNHKLGVCVMCMTYQFILVLRNHRCGSQQRVDIVSILHFVLCHPLINVSTSLQHHS